MNERIIKEIGEILRISDHAVFFGGAGVSTASGIPDFRGPTGLYSKASDGVEYYLSRECLLSEPGVFFEFYRKKMLYPDARPNEAHTALAKLEEKGIIKAQITQNIDGLHQMAGSRNVIELHGTVASAYCDRCGRVYEPTVIDNCEDIPICAACGGIVRPNVTLYGEALPVAAFEKARKEVSAADVMIVGGSSLTVQPAASFVGHFAGKHLIIVNYSKTPYDDLAEYIVRDSVTDVFSKLLEIIM